MDLRSLLNNAQSSLTSSYNNSLDGLIDRVGLERQRSQSDTILPAIGVFAAGLAIGATLGLIFAPKKGEDLREDLNDQLDHLKDRIDLLSARSRRQYEDLVSRGSDLVESAKSKLPSSSDVEEFTDKVVHKADRVAEKLTHKAERLAHKAEYVASDLKDEVSHLTHKAGQQVEKAGDKLEEAGERARDEAEKLAGKLKD